MGNDDDELRTPGDTLAVAIREAEARGWRDKDARDEARRVLSGADPTTPPADYPPPPMTGTPAGVARSLTGVVVPPADWCVVHDVDIATCTLAGRPCVPDTGEYLIGDRVVAPDPPRSVAVIHPDGGAAPIQPTSSEAMVTRDRSGSDTGRVTTRLSIDTLTTDPAVGETFINLTVTYAGDPDGVARVLREAERRAQTLGWSHVDAVRSVWDDVKARRFRPADHPDGGH